MMGKKKIRLHHLKQLKSHENVLISKLSISTQGKLKGLREEKLRRQRS